MKITNIVEIPVFISSYITSNIEDIDYQLHSFCKFLLNNYIISFSTFNNENEENENYKIEYTIDSKYCDIRYFINFYIEKSKLDHYGNCLYEKELDIDKSISNEIFIVELETDDGIKLDTINLFIDSFKSDKLVLKSI